MIKKVNDIEVITRDFYGDDCLNDTVGANNRSDNGQPTGYVKIYEIDENGKKKLLGKHNLVVYLGREWLAQRMVNANNSNVTSENDEFLTWFGLGNGGVIPGDPFNPSPPVLTNNNLSEQLMITATDSSAADYNVVDVDHPEIGFYKIPFDSVEFEQDPLNDDRWVIVKITTTVGVGHANEKQISEAGLFTAASSNGSYNGNFTLFSRVTFPSLVKTTDRRLIFSWFLYV